MKRSIIIRNVIVAGMSLNKKWLFLMKLGRTTGCHQKCDRSFFYRNYQFPLCARCTGIFIGQFLISPIVLLIGFNNLWLNLSLVALMAIDGSLQYFKIFESSNLRRLLTGLGAGYGLMSLFVFLVIKLINLF